MNKEVHLFVLWEKARYEEEKIVSLIESQFNILKKVYISWEKEKFGKNLSVFYGDDFSEDIFQISTRGDGEFLAIIVEDLNPVYDNRCTGRGIRNVNVHTFELKKKVRDTLLKNFSFHATNDLKEARKGIALLLGKSVADLLESGYFDGKTEYREANLPGIDGWKNLEELFYYLNECCTYAVLRNPDNLPRNHRMDIHGDIDILVEDMQEFLCLIDSSHSVRRDAFKFMNYISFEDQTVLIHPKFVGDNYYDINWQKRMLLERVKNTNGIYVLSKEMYFWSLLYHGIYHKDKIESYDAILSPIAKELQIDYRLNREHLGCLLGDWLVKNHYLVKKHLDGICASLNEKNVPYKYLIDTKPKFYYYQSYYKDCIYANVVFEESLIAKNPRLVTEMIKPADMFIDLERHELREDSMLYDYLCHKVKDKEYLWKYTIRFGKIMELAYGQNLISGEAQFVRKFIDGTEKIDDGVIEYCSEGIVKEIQGENMADILRHEYFCFGKDAFDKKYREFLKCSLGEFQGPSEDVLDGMAWDMIPRNCIYHGGQYTFFDKEGYYKRPIEKSHYMALCAKFLGAFLYFGPDAIVELYKESCDWFEVKAAPYDVYVEEQNEEVDKINCIEELKKNARTLEYNIFISVVAYGKYARGDKNNDSTNDEKTVNDNVVRKVKITKMDWIKQKILLKKRMQREMEQKIQHEMCQKLNDIEKWYSDITPKVDALNWKEDASQEKFVAMFQNMVDLRMISSQCLDSQRRILDEMKCMSNLKQTKNSIEVQEFNFEKKKINIYIVTYKKNDILNRNLKSLWEYADDLQNISVTILANHPDVFIEEKNIRDNMRIVYNTTRSTEAWGYLSRDWNWCILDCFENWKNPANVEWCILAQNDVEWACGWQKNLAKIDKYDMVTQPWGDQLIVLNIEAIKKIGFFDERYTTLHYHEEDYFARAILHLGDRVSINNGVDMGKSFFMSDSYNASATNLFINPTSSGIDLVDDRYHTAKTHSMLEKFFKSKWQIESNLELITTREELKNHMEARKLVATEINWYPFFWDGYSDITRTFIVND